MRRIERISGRSDDMLIIRGVNVFPSQIEVQVLKVDGLSPHFQLIVDRSGNLLELEIAVEVDPSTSRSGVELAEELTRRVKENIGVTVISRVVAEGQIPRSQGKASRVVEKSGD